MDKKQIKMLKFIYDKPMEVPKLRRKCKIDKTTFNEEYRTKEMGNCFSILQKGTPTGSEGIAKITPTGRKAVEKYELEHRTEIRAEKAVIQAWVSIVISGIAIIVSIASIILQFIF